MKKLSIILLTILSPVVAVASIGDTIINLQEVNVSARRYTSDVRSSEGVVKMNTDMLTAMPAIFGNSDPMRMLQTLPGVTTQSEFDSGFHVDGSETSHTAILLDGVPVYGVSHLLGFFSVFNPTHFGSITLNRNTFNNLSGNRLGAELNVQLPDTLPRQVFSGNITVGIMSSQGTVKLHPTEKLGIIVSARRSYLNLLYKKLLSSKDFDLKYGFGDYNASVLYTPTNRDKLVANFYYGNDAARAYDTDYLTSINLRWNNMLGSLQWLRKNGDFTYDNKVYYTAYQNKVDMVSGVSVDGELPSYIKEAAVQSNFKWRGLRVGVQGSYFDILPQSPKLSTDTLSVRQTHSQTGYLSAVVSYTHDFDFGLKLTGGVKGHYFVCRNIDKKWAVDPFLTLGYTHEEAGTFTLSGGWQTQYLSQTGFTNRGFPTEFWISPQDVRSNPQRSIGVNFNYTKSLFHSALRVEANVYYKSLQNIVEYQGDMMGMLTAYDLQSSILKGRGYNVGANIMLHKVSGNFTGWISYGWQRARRSFDDPRFPKEYPANHDRTHELNVVAAYHLKKHWDFSGTFVLSSGTPFTPVRKLFMINGAMMSQYGEHNSERLPLYSRFDVSINYNFFTKLGKHTVNLSFYNLLAQKNVIYYNVRYTRENEGVAYRPMTFLVKILPSISYTFKF